MEARCRRPAGKAAAPASPSRSRLHGIFTSLAYLLIESGLADHQEESMLRLIAVLTLLSSSYAVATQVAPPPAAAKTDPEIVAALRARLGELEASGEFSGAALLAR